MTNLILMITYKDTAEVPTSYNSTLFKPHISNVYKSEKSGYNRYGLYVEQTGKYILMAKKDGYLYAWQKRRTNNGN
jgi:hypothetical protein